LAQRGSQRIAAGGSTAKPTPGEAKRFVTIDQICDDLEISRSTYYTWRGSGKAPVGKKLPNGSVRIPVDVYEAWLDSLGEDV
jgi:predicted DNA-binding transcriptional regulator AlpA